VPAEIDLLAHYPRGGGRSAERPLITEEDKRISKNFGRDYFDGDRRHGYGGFSYHPRFWTDTVRHIRDVYQLPEDAAILDIGCAKGFMLYDFMLLMPKARIAGIDISSYAIEHALQPVKPFVQLADAKALPYATQSFDLVLAINTIHNLPYEDCQQSLREIERVSRRHAFVMVDAFRTEQQRQAMLRWVLTAETMLSTEEWLKLFADSGYTGDYAWWTVE
jgi:ubiquinone/menaquinone biosynthesis C-methylase UbiE